MKAVHVQLSNRETGEVIWEQTTTKAAVLTYGANAAATHNMVFTVTKDSREQELPNLTELLSKSKNNVGKNAEMAKRTD